MGRLKYLTPIYQAMQDFGYPIASASVAKTLEITQVHDKKTTYELIKLEKRARGEHALGTRLMRD